MDYERPIPLAGDVLKQRIFSPLAYPSVRNSNVIEIAAQEAPRYAAHFPICWRKQADRHQLVIVRSLIADGRGHPIGSQKALAFLPILCRSYPFLYAPSGTADGAMPKFIDHVIADEPSDIGSPICFTDGRPTKATAQRITMLDNAATLFAQTAAIASHLAAADLFEAWPLHFEGIEGQTLDVPNLWIVKQDVVATGALSPLMRVHGLVAADLIGLHRVSLFRTGILLANARSALKGQPNDSAATDQPELATTEATP